MDLEFNINELLKPYKEGGTANEPIERSLETISNALINRYKYPEYVVALAIWKIFYSIANEGLDFKGDDSYGSKGRELFSAIKAQCVQMLKEDAVKIVKATLTEKTICFRFDCPKRTTLKFEELSKWGKIVNFISKPRCLWLY